jgi:hypothetical protein
MNRTRRRRSVPVAEWWISFGPPKFGHNLDCMSCSFGSGVNMYKTGTLPFAYRNVQLDIRCSRNASKPALRRCLAFRNTSGLETRLNGRMRGALAEFDLTDMF